MRVDRLFILLICFASVASCARKPSNILSKAEMIDVLYDVKLAQAIYYGDYTNYNSVEAKAALMDAVLNKHGLTRAQLDTSMVWYSDNYEEYRIVNDSVLSRLRAKNDIFSKELNQINANVSRSYAILPPYFVLTDKSPTLSFRIDSINISQVDLKTFNLSFGVQGISSLDSIEAAIYFKYKDSTVRQTVRIKEDTRFRFEKPQLPDSLLQTISGYVRLRPAASEFLSPIMLYGIQYHDSVYAKQPSSLSDSTLPAEGGESFIRSRSREIDTQPKELSSQPQVR